MHKIAHAANIFVAHPEIITDDTVIRFYFKVTKAISCGVSFTLAFISFTSKPLLSVVCKVSLAVIVSFSQRIPVSVVFILLKERCFPSNVASAGMVEYFSFLKVPLVISTLSAFTIQPAAFPFQ
ncbi:MAG: hypothetical protein WDN26_19555 [Chitinophagaceae bacterium]